jgi:hypothetical protein
MIEILSRKSNPHWAIQGMQGENPCEVTIHHKGIVLIKVQLIHKQLDMLWIPSFFKQD